MAAGDWLEIGQIAFKPDDAEREVVVGMKQEYAKRPLPFRFDPAAADGPILGSPRQDCAWLWKQCIEPWKEAQQRGSGVMVGEWGVYNTRPMT